jgi:hypothetical protein
MTDISYEVTAPAVHVAGTNNQRAELPALVRGGLFRIAIAGAPSDTKMYLFGDESVDVDVAADGTVIFGFQPEFILPPEGATHISVNTGGGRVTITPVRLIR